MRLRMLFFYIISTFIENQLSHQPSTADPVLSTRQSKPTRERPNRCRVGERRQVLVDLVSPAKLRPLLSFWRVQTHRCTVSARSSAQNAILFCQRRDGLILTSDI